MLSTGLVALAVVLLVLVTRRRRDWPGPGHMQVICLDEHGRETSRKWVKIKKPDVYPDHGASHLGPYVERLMASNAWHTHLMFFTPDGGRGGSLVKLDGGLAIGLIFRSRHNPEPEARAREFFEARHAATKDDYLGDESVPGGPTRILRWWVHGSESEITALCQTVLRDLSQVKDEEGLNITYQESPKPPT